MYSAQKSFIGVYIRFWRAIFRLEKMFVLKKDIKVIIFAINYQRNKKIYLKELQPYFTSSRFVYKEKSVFDMDYKNTIIYCDPPYVHEAFRAKKIWNEEKRKKIMGKPLKNG